MQMARSIVMMITLLVGALAWTPGHAVAACQPVAGKFVSVQGTVEIMGSTSPEWRGGKLDEPLCQGDTIRVGQRSRAAVALVNDAVLRIDQNTTLRLLDIAVQEQKRSWLELVKGAIQSFSRKPRLLTVNTPYLNGSIEGTEFVFRVEGDESQLTVFEGTVVAANDQGKVAVPGGSSVAAAKGGAPISRVVVRPRQAVQWALYYPPILAGAQGGAAPAELSEAARLLEVGRADEATRSIDRVLAANPNDATALSLQAIVALVRNEEGRAMELAGRAVKAAPDSATARIALSYAQQAVFDLPAARASLEEAVKLEPGNALAWARLAEMQASFGDLKSGLVSAQRAASLEPELSRTQTVLGFAYLMQVKTAEARAAFEKATALDQADPMPRLGQGLALIREGELTEGRRKIEIAAGLDGNNALIRSYLGKAYFEEKRDDLASSQYSTAKGLDPHDPTPYFYDGILKQTSGRPIEALDEMQQAIELNDNRAVYRSRLLLDADLAARSASLARTYADLGFQDLALVEGWKSVNSDPTNFSAHRVLADSYAIRPRHEIARVSELLQSQLLQPLNSAPIQPHLAESSLGLLTQAGPSALSFNEFNPLFNRDGVTAQISGLAGNDSTFGGEGVISGIHQNIAYSIGGYRFTTDGVRTNNDQSDTIANAFLQAEISPDTSAQLEFRSRHLNHGDLLYRFYEGEIFKDSSSREESETTRIGFRHNLSPNSTILGSLIYADLKSSFSASPLPDFLANFGQTFISAESPEHAYSGELQYLYRAPGLKIVAGGGFFRVSGTQKVGFGLFIPPPDGPGDIAITASEETDLRHVNAYVYGTYDLTKSLVLNVGASGDMVDGSSPEVGKRDQFNPKLGLTWEASDRTALRLAAFRVLKRTLITNQTLEPTQVAGFNQFFDDFNATDAWRYGAAVDHKFSRTVQGGVEVSKRILKSPFLGPELSGDEQDVREYEGRAYLFATPRPWLALSAGYQYDRLRTEGATNEPLNLNTHRLPLAVSLFSESGLSGSLKATYYKQDGRFIGFFDGIRADRSYFWLVDASLRFQLPKRYGSIQLVARNLLDKEFRYFEQDLANPTIQAGRSVLAIFTVALP
jgi:tetratricopeptide (TPR) repeat protein